MTTQDSTLILGGVAAVAAAILAIGHRRRRAAAAAEAGKAKEKKKAKGPMATGRRWFGIAGNKPTTAPPSGLPVPFFFHEESAEAFHKMPTRADDVVVSSLPKGGTTWVTRILFDVLHGFDDAGRRVGDPTKQLNAQGQTYPESLPLEPPEPEAEGGEELPITEKVRRQFFGEWGLSDMLSQPSPRLFTTHLFGEYLPAQLTAPGGQGKLVIVLRNLKDTLASLHYFRGEAKDGWLGNEHGPGSLSRFVDADSPNAYGSVWRMLRDNDALAASLQAEGRVLVVYYEALKERLPTELERINAFLGRPPLTADKKAAVLADVGFDAMKRTATAHESLLRKGGIGDWRTHLDEATWGVVDTAFDEQLKGVVLAEPLRCVRVVRHLLGLEEVISMDVADGQSSGGWVFLDGVTCSPWAGQGGPFFLHRVYQHAAPGCTTRLTVPVLWDTHTNTIVSNDSWGLCKMLCTAFAPLGKPTAALAKLTPAAERPLLYPGARAAEIDARHKELYASLLNGVYRAGIAKLFGNEAGAAAGAADVYATLAKLESQLAAAPASRPFLLGASPTLVDVRLTMTLLRYDASYIGAFGLRGGQGGILTAGPGASSGSGHPHLKAYLQRVYKLIAPTVDWPAFRQYYRWGPGMQPNEPLPPLAPLKAAAEAGPSRCKVM